MFNTIPSENGFYHKQPILSVINKIYLTTKQKQKQTNKQYIFDLYLITKKFILSQDHQIPNA